MTRASLNGTSLNPANDDSIPARDCQEGAPGELHLPCCRCRRRRRRRRLLLAMLAMQAMLEPLRSSSCCRCCPGQRLLLVLLLLGTACRCHGMACWLGGALQRGCRCWCNVAIGWRCRGCVGRCCCRRACCCCRVGR